MKGGPFGDIEKFQNSLIKPKKGMKPHSAEKVEMGTLLLWNAFVFHVRGFGHVQNQVLSTHGTSARSTQKVVHSG